MVRILKFGWNWIIVSKVWLHRWAVSFLLPATGWSKFWEKSWDLFFFSGHFAPRIWLKLENCGKSFTSYRSSLSLTTSYRVSQFFWKFVGLVFERPSLGSLSLAEIRQHWQNFYFIQKQPFFLLSATECSNNCVDGGGTGIAFREGWGYSCRTVNGHILI